MNSQYTEAYHKIKDKKVGKEIKEFSFSEKYIFGRFDSFCQRLKNLLDMFQTINQFSDLFKSRMEALLAEDALADDSKKFNAAVKQLTEKDYDYLDFRNLSFDRDYSDFLGRMDDLTGRLQAKLESTYDGIWDTPHAFQYLTRFEKLTTVLPISGMNNKYMRMIATFKKEMERTLVTFKKQTGNPPIVWNYPTASGKIYWVRSLVNHMKSVIDKFDNVENLKRLKEYRKLVKQYNEAGIFLMQYELKVQEGWTFRNPKIRKIEEKIAYPILKEAKNGEIHINFDESFFALLQESEKLMKLDIPLPSVNQALLTKKKWFYDYKSMVEMMLANYNTAVKSVVPEWKRLFSPFLNKIRQSLDPGFSIVNWYNHEWKEFTEKCINEIALFQNLIDRANDIYSNRINTILESMDYVELYNLPKKEAWTFEKFLSIVKEKCKLGTDSLEQKSKMIEEAVEDIIQLALDTLFEKKEAGSSKALEKQNSRSSDLLTVNDREQQSVMEKISNDIRKNYSKKILEKLEVITRNALKHLTKYFSNSVVETCSKPQFDFEEQEGVDYSFVLTTFLAIPEIEVLPNIEQIQASLVQAGNLIMSVSKGVGQWLKLLPKKKTTKVNEVSTIEEDRTVKLYNPVKKTKAIIEEKPHNFYGAVAENKEVSKAFAQLSSCLSGLKIELSNFSSRWKKFKDLWEIDREEFLHDFVKQKPSIYDFENELKKYNLIEAEVEQEPNEFRYGQMLINNVTFKETLKNEIKQWINGIGATMHKKYKNELDVLYAQINDIDKKLDRSINDLDDIRIIMETQKKLREVEIDLDMKIDLVENAFSMMAKYELQMTKEDVERVEGVGPHWLETQAKAMQTYVLLLEVQEDFKKALIDNVALFQLDCDQFCKDYVEKGPMEEGLPPREASDRLEAFQSTFDTLWRKHNSYSVGEDLFGLPHTDQSEMEGIKKELNLLQRLYKLYNDVIDSVDSYHKMLWKTIDIEEISNELMEYQNRCRKLPKGLKEWPAFQDLKKIIDDFSDICPILELMSNKAMKQRHWQRIETMTKYKFDFEKPKFALNDLMEAPLLENKEDIEDVCISAMKEKDIEAKLKGVVMEWSTQELEFLTFKNRGELLLRGDTTAETVSQVEDSLMILGSLLSNRYNAPFKKQIQKWVQDLSNTNEILERWLLVQNLWVYLEAVFVGGDIAKQLPKEAKRFYRIDKTWQKIMQRAHDQTSVVSCCVGDDFLKQTLPNLQEQLELCQKSLTGYLEKKRLLFPRFFFVSDPSLLEILGQASDSHTIQAHLLSIFENVASVKFDPGDYNKIVAIISKEGEVVSLDRAVRAEGSVEIWLMQLLMTAKESLNSIIRNAYHIITDSNFDMLEFIKKYQAQVGILGIQMIWTRDSETALQNCRVDKKIMGDTNNKFLDMLNTLIGQTVKNLTKIERTKFETLITVHMHQRDIFDMLVRLNIKSSSDFEWLKQTRFYFKPDEEKTNICITDVAFLYQNEFIGCQERLVITPLTDRCFITLAQAIGMCMGGAPAGPAGTGKTETVKDMAKCLGKYCVVFNCSDQMDFKGLGRIFKGLAQSGSWGCFDEFNRIILPVLSVCAQQCAVIFGCKKDKKKKFTFTDGDIVDMNPEFGVFITMNPTYAGRQELPENLKIQFRNVSMMVPDRQIIIRVKLASCGFLENITLARKFFTLYKLCEEQLTKQVHYDFGLRNILSVLRTLGRAKRENPKDTETTTVMRILKDMNVSKLVDEDEPLFVSLINDLFPNMNVEKCSYKELEYHLKEILGEAGLVYHPSWAVKMIQLYETQRVRHGMMVLGPSGAGKTTCIHTLMEGLTALGNAHKEYRLNPKSITAPQMFGRLDVATNDWCDGIFAALWRRTMKSKKQEFFWLVLDGPVDPMWIENLNSVLDDSKILTLANGDRLSLPSTVKIVFEPRDVDNASPATVSRNGMIYMSSSGLDWKPKLKCWISKNELEEKHSQPINDLFNKTFEACWKFASVELNFVMPILQVNVFQAVLLLLEGILPCMQPLDEEEEKRRRNLEKAKNKKKYDEDGNELPEVEEEDPFQNDHEQTFIFALCWAFGSFLEDAGRLKLEAYLRESSGLKLPDLEKGSTIFDFNVNPRTGEWKHWNSFIENYVPPEINPNAYGDILIPNVSSIRTEFILDTCVRLGGNVLITGGQGSAKTSILNAFLSKYNPEERVFQKSNFSATTNPQLFQKTLEASVDKRMGSTFGPPIGKTMTIFIDDLNQPEVNKWGDQITNELFRSVIENKGFYSLDKPGDFITLVDMRYLSAMIHPGGGRNDIPERLKRHFFVLNNTLPNDAAIDRIFSTIVLGHFSAQRGFSDEVSDTAQQLVSVTRELWQSTKNKLLPTPSKFHYVFNLRDLSRIWLGMIATQSNVIATKEITMQLWKNEVSRTIADRFVADTDKEWFNTELCRVIEDNFGPDEVPIVKENRYFVDFMRDAPEPTGEEDGEGENELPKVYEPVENFKTISDRLNFFLEQYNDIMRGANMDLVFFEDAICHLLRIARAIRNPGGNIMLVGVGGSGKQSLTKLASFIASYKTFQIAVTRSYNISNFIEDLKVLFRNCGVSGNKTTFLFTDQDIKEESFLEYVNNVLASGLASQIFTKDEQGEIVTELAPIMKRECPRVPPTPENTINWFLERVKLNLHVVLCFSPIGEAFRVRSLKFPALFSGCTIDWYQPWPREALVAVASHFMSAFPIKCSSDAKKGLFKTMANVQDSVSQACESYFQRFRRTTHVTPKSFLNFISSYKDVYSKKHEQIADMSVRMDSGLEKLHEAADSVAILSEELKVMEKELEVANQKAEKVLIEVTQAAKEAEKVRNKVMIVKEACEQMVESIAVEKALAEEKLEAARPALEEAEAALNTIKPANIATVRKLGRPPHLIMRVMDCVLILFRRKLVKMEADPTVPSPLPSWQESLKIMSGTSFLSDLLNYPKDTINDEMVELLEPYFTMEDYNQATANRVCSDVAGLLCWTKAMGFFFGVNKEVLPLKLNLAIAQNKLIAAKKDLETAENKLRKKEKGLNKCKEIYCSAVQEKQKLANQADNCRRKMTSASTLINGLTGEKVRWTETSKNLKEQLGRLIGDTLLACGFLSYAGPFNQEYRQQLLAAWKSLLKQRNVSFTKDLNVVNMLVDTDEMSEWALQGLPNDELSLQNASIVTKGRSYPLLIDPQGQGKNWIKTKNQYNDLQITNLNHKYFRTHLEDSLSLGRPLLIEDVAEELDPILNNLLERNVIRSGKVDKIMVGDREMELLDGFTLYITTKMGNPSYSPEISARTAIIDFTVTISGLEDQLLGRVIRMEKSDLETERIRLVEDVIENKATMKELEDNLLEKLTSVQGSLVDDEDLIAVLQETKETAAEVSKKLLIAGETEVKINAAREEFRPVATRGSILYFLIVELSKVNLMYQTSLKQFLGLFDNSVTKSKPTHIVPKRLENIIDFLTKAVWHYTSRGLYEQHKFLFTLLLALKIDMQLGKVSHSEFLYLLKGGASLDLNSVKPKPYRWMLDVIWLNLVEMSKIDVFSVLLEKVIDSEKDWKSWCDTEAPEEEEIPCGYEDSLDVFRKLLLIRAWCPDRTLPQARKYIYDSLGASFLENIVLDLEGMIAEADNRTPLLCLLSVGSDPTNQIDALAKNIAQPYHQLSMGQGQEEAARKMMVQGMEKGQWVMLQNCHLSVEFCDEIIQSISDTENVHENFKMWITTEINKNFPMSLLQMSIKYTNEPPQGIRSGLKRIYSDITQDNLDYSSNDCWPTLLYSVAFTHTIVQERRKFGPLGWNVPYEFNSADFKASTQFIINHLDDLDPRRGISWPTVQFMLSEVQYGGRVTDDFDKRLLITLTHVWFTEALIAPAYKFYDGYPVPEARNIDEYNNFIQNMPLTDCPEVFGLHKNADISYQINTAKGILDEILNIQPKESGGGKPGETREAVVYKLADDMLRKLPKDYAPHEVREAMVRLGGPLPMNIFLRQEIARMQKILTLVRDTLTDLKLAIEGTIIMSENLKASLDSMYDARVPENWKKLSWLSTTLGFWYTELLERDGQFKRWCYHGRPKVFWITGFFNPQGFFTAMRQEVTRLHKGWALDSVICQVLLIIH